ncbi:hypothetical protein D3C81_2190780 [compost metagenome]
MSVRPKRYFVGLKAEQIWRRVCALTEKPTVKPLKSISVWMPVASTFMMVQEMILR